MYHNAALEIRIGEHTLTKTMSDDTNKTTECSNSLSGCALHPNTRHAVNLINKYMQS